MQVHKLGSSSPLPRSLATPAAANTPLPALCAVQISPIKDTACSEPGSNQYTYSNTKIRGHYVKPGLISTRLDTARCGPHTATRRLAGLAQTLRTALPAGCALCLASPTLTRPKLRWYSCLQLLSADSRACQRQRRHAVLLARHHRPDKRCRDSPIYKGELGRRLQPLRMGSDVLWVRADRCVMQTSADLIAVTAACSCAPAQPP